ncbi:MAG: aminotransferase [Polaromonas sp.]|nr:aminotransferase [Polaromonas sp.]
MKNAFQPPAPRIHGGPDRHGAALHDFSTNSNACAPCPAALAAVQLADASRYPDASYAHLRRQLADFHGVDARRIVLAGSASEFIFRITALAAQAAPAAPIQRTAGEGESQRRQGMGGQGSAGGEQSGAVWLPPHSYGDYAQAASAHRLSVAADPARARLVWACEPSSPLGAAQAGLGEMAGLLALQPHKPLLVLDRAYEPLRLGGAPTLTETQLQTVWQLWTPNKALGLTGVRAAYAIAPSDAEEAVCQLEQLSPSWPVGVHGVAMLGAWTDPGVQAWLAGSLDSLRDWKARQIALCKTLGWTCLPSDANFFCARPALPEGLSLEQALAELRSHGIKLRDTASFGLHGHVRVSVQAPAAQKALQNAWQQLNKANE